jgi:hypothetical protein
MKAIYEFIVEPIGERYNNSIKIDDTELLLNTEMQNHSYSNRQAKVLAIPTGIATDIKVGDEVLLHHNVFRRFRDIRGDEVNSRSYYKDNIYFASEDQIYAYNRIDKSCGCNSWKACKGYNFVKPIKETKMFSTDFEKPGIGVLYLKDTELEGIVEQDLIGFRPGAEYEFIVNGHRVFRVPTNSITIKYEYQGDEEEYNPGWTQSS